MIRATIAGLHYEAKSLAEVGQYYHMLAGRARNDGLMARTIKEARYHEGRASAFQSVGDMLAKMEIDQ